MSSPTELEQEVPAGMWPEVQTRRGQYDTPNGVSWGDSPDETATDNPQIVTTASD